MDFDLEIISEESECPDPLFDSIMNAMNSMKEATADKIYQKIQRDGETNYSKPQVDRALANALKYGIFEVRNNRYRVRDDIIDDEDTVYWKLQKKREQTPFRILDGNEKSYGPKLDPEKDNLRFKKMSKGEDHECPQCGRIKRPADPMEGKMKPAKKPRTCDKSKRKKNTRRGRQNKKGRGVRTRDKSDDCETDNIEDYREPKRKITSEGDRSINVIKSTKGKLGTNSLNEDINCQFSEDKLNDLPEQDFGKYDTTDSEADSLSSVSDDEQSYHSYSESKKQKFKRNFYSSDCDDMDPLSDNIAEIKRSGVSLQTETQSVETVMTTVTQCDSPSKTQLYENLPCTSKNAANRERSQYTPNSSDLYGIKEYVGGQTNQCDEKTDWLGCSDEPQGAIIQTNNILTIEPMDSFAIKSPEETSYFS